MEKQVVIDVLHRKVDKLAELHQVSRDINYCHDLNKLLEMSLNAAMRMLESDAGSIFLLSADGQKLELRISRGKKKDLAGMVKKVGEGISGMVAHTKMPILVRDTREDPQFAGSTQKQYRTYSFISAPLVTTNKLIGVINITEKRTGEPFDTDDLGLISILASHVAIAIEKLQLYDEIKQLNLKLEEKVKLATSELRKNISEKLELEKQLAISKRLASIGRLAANIAHELNNPLDGVMRFVNLSLEHAKDSDEVLKEYLSEAKEGLARMSEISRSLLDFFRKTVATNVYVDIHDELEKALILTHRLMNFKKVDIVKKYYPELPQILDRGIQIAFSNIIKNSIEAMPKGGKIEIATHMDKENIYIKFNDNGHGIPVEIQENIFNPFFTTKEIGKGCGLGLAICNEIIQRYNGKIALHSIVGQGTEFTISIPKQKNIR